MSTLSKRGGADRAPAVRARVVRPVAFALSALLASAGLVALSGAPATAAPGDDKQQFVTTITPGTISAVGESLDMTFGDTGYTATTQIIENTGAPGSVRGISGPAPGENANSFVTPAMPDDAMRFGQSTGSAQSGNPESDLTQRVTFNEAVKAPRIHVVNLDGSSLTIRGTSTTGAPLTFERVSSNSKMQATSTTLNTDPGPAAATGCQGEGETNRRGACGTYIITATSGDVETFELVNYHPYGDGWSWTLSLPRAELAIEKTSDAGQSARVGDIVNYEVQLSNTGFQDYVAGIPASLIDDLSGVLDDAEWNDDAAVSFSDGSTGAAPVLDGDDLTWSGPLKVGETATFTYSVTLTNDGDGQVRNNACVPETDAGENEACASTETRLPKLTVDKVADTTELPENGGTVTYTVTVENQGPGDATAGNPATISDDLSDVLDDGAFVEGSLESSSGETVRDGDTLSWSGSLAAGDTATITYQVTYDANRGGSNQLVNVVCLPDELAADPTDACRTVSVPGADLKQWKTSDPAPGSILHAGDEVTYTLHFRNDGQTAATVDNTDDLSRVLDDAELIAEPVASAEGLTATRNGETISVAGSVPVGETITVSYTVMVLPFSEQGDHVLANALAECDPDNQGRCSTEHPIRGLGVEKTSDVQEARTGDTVTYSVTVTNLGAVEYTVSNPASMSDDLSAVIDDATYNDDATATDGAVSYIEPNLTWSGPLATGASVTITYSVTVTNAGDQVLQNTACVPRIGEDDDCATVEFDLPKVIASKTSDPEPGAAVHAGDVITYTLSWENVGRAAGVVDSTDDLSEVIDDADVTAEPVSDSDAVTVTRTGEQLRVVGQIGAGETVTVTYQVTVKADGDRGNNQLTNVLVPDQPCENGECPPVVEHPVGELHVDKSVDPASGSTVREGDVLTYTLSFANVGKAPVEVAHDDVLVGILDDADVTAEPTTSSESLDVSAISDGRFTVSGELAAGASATVTYQVTVKPTGERGDDRLGNFLVPSGEQPPEICVPEIPCTVNPVSDILIEKSSDPESGSRVNPGDEITYTVTFTNRSTNPEAAPADVDVTDHMGDVLDDADLTGQPVVAGGSITATVSEQLIRIVGTLASGETATVTYAVTVKAYADQGDHRIGNVVAVTGEEPLCVEGSKLCTEHEVPPPPASPGGQLPYTGVDVSMTILGALALLGVGGLAVVVGWTRRRTRLDLN